MKIHEKKCKNLLPGVDTLYPELMPILMCVALYLALHINASNDLNGNT